MYRACEVSVHRACCERADQPYSLGGGGGGGVRFDQAQVVCIPSRTLCGIRLYPFLISVLLFTLQGQEFLVVRGSFSLNAELGEIC